jgi:hypothetical protein
VAGGPTPIPPHSALLNTMWEGAWDEGDGGGLDGAEASLDRKRSSADEERSASGSDLNASLNASASLTTATVMANGNNVVFETGAWRGPDRISRAEWTTPFHPD